ncbi:hypothetical protein BT69DRAFT_1287560, partial [Atractiella rhizophila]
MYLHSLSTVHLSAQLYANESILLSQDAVGIYRGKSKEPSHPSGTVHLTSHRLIYHHPTRPEHESFYILLKDVRRTESWIGFLRSSAKITLLLGPQSTSSADIAESNDVEAGASWVCSICAFSNGAEHAKCTLCGVKRSSSTPNPSPAVTSLSSSPSAPAVTPDDIRISCPACTYLNHPSLSHCEICGSALASASLPATVPSSAAKEEEFYEDLKRAISRRAWVTLPTPQTAAGAGKEAKKEILIGIDGLIKRIDIEAETQRSDLQSAFADLDTLMYRYKDALTEAQALSTKLDQAQSAGTDTTSIKSTLLSLGLVEPAVMDGDGLELCRELVGVLNGRGVRLKGGREGEGLMADERGKGIMSLDEVWCAWNRARRVSLVSPEDLLKASRHLSTVSSSPLIRMKTFPSGLSILYTPYYASPALADRIVLLLTSQTNPSAESSPAQEQEDPFSSLPPAPKGATTLDVALAENLNIALTQELLEDLEDGGSLSRDDGGKDGTRWFQNLFTDYSWRDVNGVNADDVVGRLDLSALG